MNKRLKASRVLLVALFIGQLFAPITVSAGPASQTITPEERALALMETMTPEELVGQLFLVDFEGNSQFIADLKSLGGGGPAVMAANPVSGDVFWIPHGPYELYKITPDGEMAKVATGLFGDPWGMVVSQDGKYVYVAESGVIDKIPIGDS